MKPFSDLTGKEKSIELLRWVFVLPASVLAVLALGIIAGVAMPPTMAQLPGTPLLLPSDFHRFILPRIFGALMAAAFVIAGAKMAPRRRVATAVGLAAVWMLYSFMIHVLVHLGRGKAHYAHFVMAAVASAGAAAYIFYSAKLQGRRP
jgi:hypothetical protein